MPSKTTPAIIRPLIERFEKRRPVRAGSLIVTLYGDAIAPRGGSLWLGSLNTLLEPFGIEPGLVRTALSRLVADGWFERRRIGRSSYHRLSARGTREFAKASRRIYADTEPGWSGRIELCVLTATDAKERQEQRDTLAATGYGQLAPNVMLRPVTARARTSTEPPPASNGLQLIATTDTLGDAQRLASRCWDLDKLGGGYQSLLDDIADLAANPDGLARLRDAQAFQLRLILIHEWRRIVLRDPLLPREMLPRDWPGSVAREAVRKAYLAVSPGCERWLDAQAVNEKGRLPPADSTAAKRFGDLD